MRGRAAGAYRYVRPCRLPLYQAEPRALRSCLAAEPRFDYRFAGAAAGFASCVLR